MVTIFFCNKSMLNSTSFSQRLKVCSIVNTTNKVYRCVRDVLLMQTICYLILVWAFPLIATSLTSSGGTDGDTENNRKQKNVTIDLQQH